MMEVRVDETDSDKDHEIWHNAERCRASFVDILTTVSRDEAVLRRIPLLLKQPLKSRPILTILDLRDEFEQFRLWADNIGVFAADHGSLDYRLREAFDVRHGLVSFLQSLYEDLLEGMYSHRLRSASLIFASVDASQEGSSIRRRDLTGDSRQRG
jgi:hypothetical protein